LQTFYVETSTANLVFHAESATELWFPSSKVFYSDDGTIVSPIGLGKGAIYSVESQVSAPTSQQLRADSDRATLSAAVAQTSLQLPHAYPRVKRLAQTITKHDTTTYDRVESLIAWMGSHTHYSLDIPPLPAGADTVDEFLFENRTGFCEQISTSLAVMLRSIGIPTREVVGYVPGPYDPITDLYQIRAEDAHAWVQVWFPGYGWQSFDPTAVVPLANPSPGATALHDLAATLCAGAARAPSHGQSGSPAAQSVQVDVPAILASHTSPSSSTPPCWTAFRQPIRRHGCSWHYQWKPASTDAETCHSTPDVTWSHEREHFEGRRRAYSALGRNVETGSEP
jgi:transglutaminase-like putative cysteine protease